MSTIKSLQHKEERSTCASLNKRVKKNELQIKLLLETVRNIQPKTIENANLDGNDDNLVITSDMIENKDIESFSDVERKNLLVQKVTKELKQNVLSAARNGEDEIALEIIDILETSIYHADTWILEKFKIIQQKMIQKNIEIGAESFLSFQIKSLRKVPHIFPEFPGNCNLYLPITLELKVGSRNCIKKETPNAKEIEKWLNINIDNGKIEKCNQEDLNQEFGIELVNDFHGLIQIDATQIKVVKKSKHSIDLFEKAEILSRFLFKWTLELEFKQLKLKENTRNFFGFIHGNTAYRCLHLPIDLCNNSEVQYLIAAKIVDSIITNNNTNEKIFKMAYKNLVIIAANDFGLIMQISSRVYTLLQIYNIDWKQTMPSGFPSESITLHKFDVRGTSIYVNKTYLKKLEKKIADVQDFQITTENLIRMFNKLQCICLEFPIMERTIIAIISELKQKDIPEIQKNYWKSKMQEMVNIISETRFQGKDYELEITEDQSNHNHY